MRRTAFRLALLWAVAGGIMFLLTAPAGADSSRVYTSAEAWYQTAGCTAVSCTVPTPTPTPTPVREPLPIPAPSPSADPYPPGTLHVGIAQGQEQARSYAKLDLFTLPFGAQLQGGTMVLPVVRDEDAGTVAPETASIDVCFMEETFDENADGAIATPPEADCTTSARAHYVVQRGAASFTVDMRALTARWEAGETNNGLAVVPSEAARNAGATWHVSLAGEGSGAPRTIEAAMTFTIPPPPALPTPFQPPAVTFPRPVPVPAAPVPTAPPRVVQPPAPAPVAPVAFTTPGFQYAAIFLLPLAALGVWGLLGYSLTRDIVVP